VWLSQRAKKRVTVLPAEYKAKIDTTLDEIFKTIDTDGVQPPIPHPLITNYLVRS
jgi:hypothetical protein